MSKAPHIKITTGNDCCSAEIFIDGKKVEGVRKVSFCKTAGTLPVLQLDLLATDMEIDAVVIPALPDILQPFYESRSVGSEKRIGLSKDKKFATYNLELIQEVMHYLKDIDTDKSKELLRKLICPCPRNM